MSSNPEWVVFPDVEAAVIAALQAGLALAGMGSVPVATRIPNPRPATHVRILRAGGTRETIVSEQAWIITEAYADREADASQLMSLCRAILHAQEDPIFGTFEVSGPVNLPDPTTSQIRYTATIGIRVRGNPVTPTTAP